MRYLVTLPVLFIFFVSSALAADTWTPFQFEVGNNFKYRIVSHESDRAKELGLFSFEVVGQNDKNLNFSWIIEEKGSKLTGDFESTNSQLSGKILINIMVGGSELAEIISQNLFAPTLEMQYRNLLLQEGEVVSRRGGSAELVVGESQEVAGIDGFKVSYSEKGRQIFVHVININSPLPLLVKTIDEDRKTIVCELVSFD